MGERLDPQSQAARLTCWSGTVVPEPIAGGLSNHSFLVRDRASAFVVRIGEDLPLHGVVRADEARASRAAHAAGVSPELVHIEPGALVFRYIEGRTLRPEDVRDPATLRRIVTLLGQCHLEVGRHLRGPALMFWVFHAVRNYCAALADGKSPYSGRLPDLLARSSVLENAIGPVDIRFGHNDLLAANLIDDGSRLWLIDWEYAGYNSPLLDLAGLASNSELGPELEDALLDAYFHGPPDAQLRRRYAAMKCASLLREAMWSMVQETTSRVSFDYAAYTSSNLTRFERAWTLFV